jgi:hypothetical protein
VLGISISGGLKVLSLQFSEDIFGFGQDAYVDYNNGDDRGGEIMTNLGDK